MKSLVLAFNRPLVSDRAAVFAAQLACFAAAMAVFIVPVLKLSSLGLTEGDLMIGLLTATACMLLMVNLGVVLPLAARVGKDATTRG